MSLSIRTSIFYPKPSTFSEKALSKLSQYFDLGGSRATVIDGNNVRLDKGNITWRTAALKVASYIVLAPITVILFVTYAGLHRQRRFVVLKSQPTRTSVIVPPTPENPINLNAGKVSNLTAAQYLFCAKRGARSQQGCCGEFSKEIAKKFLLKLQRNPTPGISFESTVDQYSEIRGTCTAMSIKFAAAYFGLKKKRDDEMLTREQFEVELGSLKEVFEISSEKMRSRQIAYSSIRVDSKEGDYSKNKIESCVRSHHFEIEYTSSEKDVHEKEFWEQEINDLEFGVYFIRMLKPDTNSRRLEARAHSMIYIHEADAAYFYDNNFGLEKIPQIEGINRGNFLYERLLAVHGTWDIPSMQLYRLKRDQPIVSKMTV